MMKFLVYVCLLLFLFSCQENKEVVPEGVLIRDRMIDVMVDVEMTQALIRFKLSRKDTVNQAYLFDEMFSEYGISEKEFNNSLNYYSQNPKILLDLYVDVITAISEKQAKDQ